MIKSDDLFAFLKQIVRDLMTVLCDINMKLSGDMSYRMTTRIPCQLIFNSDFEELIESGSQTKVIALCLLISTSHSLYTTCSNRVNRCMPVFLRLFHTAYFTLRIFKDE